MIPSDLRVFLNYLGKNLILYLLGLGHWNFELIFIEVDIRWQRPKTPENTTL